MNVGELLEFLARPEIKVLDQVHVDFDPNTETTYLYITDREGAEEKGRLDFPQK